MNVGPKPDGEIPIEQEERLREMALGMLVNSEMIYSVRPWILTNECDYWFTKAKSEVRPLDHFSVLGQNDRVPEYQM